MYYKRALYHINRQAPFCLLHRPLKIFCKAGLDGAVTRSPPLRSWALVLVVPVPCSLLKHEEPTAKQGYRQVGRKYLWDTFLVLSTYHTQIQPRLNQKKPKKKQPLHIAYYPLSAIYETTNNRERKFKKTKNLLIYNTTFL